MTPLVTEIRRYGVIMTPLVTEIRRYGVIMTPLVTENRKIWYHYDTSCY